MCTFQAGSGVIGSHPKLDVPAGRQYGPPKYIPTLSTAGSQPGGNQGTTILSVAHWQAGDGELVQAWVRSIAVT